MFGDRNCVGAIIIPLTAPSTAAKPQPSASSHEVRTPRRRAAPGLSAPARIARPSFVKRKKSQSTATHAIVTPNVPTSCFEMCTPPTTQVLVGNGLGKNCSCGDQIHAASPFRITSRAIVAITTVRTLARSSGWITTRWRPTPNTNAITSVTMNAGQYESGAGAVRDQRPGDVGREHRHLALREVDHLGRLVDQHERERERP